MMFLLFGDIESTKSVDGSANEVISLKGDFSFIEIIYLFLGLRIILKKIKKSCIMSYDKNIFKSKGRLLGNKIEIIKEIEPKPNVYMKE